MPNDPDAPAAGRRSPGKDSTLARFALIGVVLAAVAATFAYFGGWFSPNELTPARFTDGFEHVNGVHSGFRRNHAKGVGVSGFFESNGNGVRLSRAVVFHTLVMRDGMLQRMLPWNIRPQEPASSAVDGPSPRP